jgi:hypothetical protein
MNNHLGPLLLCLDFFVSCLDTLFLCLQEVGVELHGAEVTIEPVIAHVRVELGESSEESS